MRSTPAKNPNSTRFADRRESIRLQFRGAEKAERLGFEPRREFDPPTRVPGVLLNPLGHRSASSRLIIPMDTGNVKRPSRPEHSTESAPHLVAVVAGW